MTDCETPTPIQRNYVIRIPLDLETLLHIHCAETERLAETDSETDKLWDSEATWLKDSSTYTL